MNGDRGTRDRGTENRGTWTEQHLPAPASGAQPMQPTPPARPVQPAPPVPPPAPPQPRQLSAAGLQFLIQREGFVGHMYNDSAGHCTVGYGHLVHFNNCDGRDHREAEFLHGITRERAAQLLRADSAAAAAEVNTRVTVPLNQTQLDALVSFVFNVGAGNFRNSTLLRNLNTGDYAGVPQQLSRFVRAGGQVSPGLVLRRQLEGALFQNGAY
jgi:lysozyme